MKISALVIVKNEEAILRDALESVKDFHEIVVVDTGSTDRTVEIAKKYTDKIFNFPWCDDFSKARNYAIEKATGDWCFSIDADHVLLSPLAVVCDEAEKAAQLGHKTALVKSMAGSHVHWRDVLFKRDPEVFWVGAVHEHLNKPASHKSSVERHCGYSGNHAKDPDRNLRILLASERTTRNKFYLGREYFEHKKYDDAILWMKSYLKEGKWVPEIAEAYLTIAKCYWFTNRGSEARDACMEAIRVNPDFKEALLLMSTMHFSPWKEKWKAIGMRATNSDVLFVRN